MIYNIYVYDSKENQRDFIATFTNLKKAKAFVINNETDIWETCFDKAIIEFLSEGAHYGQTDKHLVYQYDKNTNTYIEMADQKEEHKKITTSLFKESEQNILIDLILKNGIVDKKTNERFLPEQISITRLNNKLCIRTIYCDLYYFEDFRNTWRIYHD